jgi:hypothetical protein
MSAPVVLSPELRAEVERSLAPVRPLRPPWRRTLVLVPVALLLLGGIPRLFGWRHDAASLGLWLAWGASAAQALAGLVLLAAALTEAVPARQIPRRALGALLAGSLLVFLAVTLATWLASGSHVPLGREAVYWRVCFGTPVALGVPALMIAAWLVARAWPVRPELAGLIYGLGCGLLVDSGWRLFCGVADPRHVLSAHALAVVTLGALGAMVAHAWRRRR